MPLLYVPRHTFFVDQHPEANWAHECAYAHIGASETCWADAQWPPPEGVRLIPIK
jgi:hypothetical protein